MTRKKYRIVVNFTYKNGTPGGVLDTVVNSRKAVDIQLDANNAWLSAKGHTPTNTTITEVPTS